MSQGQINDVGYEVSRKDLETLTKSEIKPSWVDSNEEIIKRICLQKRIMSPVWKRIFEKKKSLNT